MWTKTNFWKSTMFIEKTTKDVTSLTELSLRKASNIAKRIWAIRMKMVTLFRLLNFLRKKSIRVEMHMKTAGTHMKSSE